MNNLSESEKVELTDLLKKRFLKNITIHKDINFDDVLKKIKNSPKLYILNEMEKTGGEPDLVLYNKEKDEYTFYDCSKESPLRRSLCYDKEALDSRKNFKPKSSVMETSLNMGIEVLNEEEYRFLQTLGEFDLKTSSYLKTPNEIRKQGGAIFGDRRYNTVFIYHNGAESYYESRGFRGKVTI